MTDTITTDTITTDTITTDTITTEYDGNHVYHRYPGQAKPQPAYIEMDALGYVSVDWSGEIGDVMPSDVWCRARLRWRIPSASAPHAINELLTQHRDLLASVHAGHTVEFDGSNWIGHLTAAARAASDELEQLCDSLDCLDVCQHQAWWAESVKAEGSTLIIDGTDIQLSSQSSQQAIQLACLALDSLTHAHPLTELIIGHASDWVPDMVATLPPCD